VRHATSTDRYRVTFQLDRRAAKIVIADAGKGFALNGSTHHMAATLSEGGRGLALMEMLMDEADFRVEEGRGTRVSLTKQVVLKDSSLLREDS
jgi:anti-sigma regulatory factor (Ser/Thr protein kinase)